MLLRICVGQLHAWAKNGLKQSYAYKQLLEQNGWLPLGTDFPVENINPIYTFYAAVERKDLKGNPEDGFQMENALSRKQALQGITIWAAKGNFEENEKGSIEPGKYADFVILDKDIMKVKGSELPGVKVLYTYVNGEKVYEKSRQGALYADLSGVYFGQLRMRAKPAIFGPGLCERREKRRRESNCFAGN